MPATVRISESARTSLRAIIIIAAAVILLIPIAFSVAHGASRLNYGSTEMSEPLPETLTDLSLDLKSGASVVVKTTDDEDPSVKFTATGPRNKTPGFNVDTTGDATSVKVADKEKFENTKIEFTIPRDQAHKVKLDFSGDYGTFDIAGDYREIIAGTDGGAIDIDGSAERVETSTDWGATDLSGSFGTIDARTDVGSLDGSDLTVRKRVDAVTSTGTVDLEFTDDAVPEAGISAKTEEGTIDLRLPNLDLAQEKANAKSAGQKSGSAGAADAEENLIYRISANSTEGSVDLADELKKYDASKNSKGEDGKKVIPVSATADTGQVTIRQN